MKALILAAGRGTRLQPMTNSIPKPMIPIVHKPIMETLVDLLRSHRFDEIVVNTSHLASEIETYFRDGHRFGVQMSYSFEGYKNNGKIVSQPLGSAGAIRKIHEGSGFFDSTFAVLCGDAMVDMDLSRMLAFHRQKGALATVALKTLPDIQLENYGVALCDGDNRIHGFQEKPKRGEARSHQASTGIYIFEPEILAHIPASGSFDIGGQLFPQLVAVGAPVYGVELPFTRWFDIGRLEDYHRTVMQVMVGYVDGFKLPGREVRSGLRVGSNVRADFSKIHSSGPVYIGSGATISDDAVLVGPVVIGAGSVIGSGAHIERSVVMDDTRIGGFAYLKNKVIGNDYCFDADGTVLDAGITDSDWLFASARSLNMPLNDEQRWVMAHNMEAATASAAA
jgi:mannose-1-phosphate guanylyltransferase